MEEAISLRKSSQYNLHVGVEGRSEEEAIYLRKSPQYNRHVGVDGRSEEAISLRRSPQYNRHVGVDGRSEEVETFLNMKVQANNLAKVFQAIEVELGPE